MSDVNNFLKKVLSDQDVKENDTEVSELREERKNVESKINAVYATAKKTIRYGGSYAKDTMIKSNYDLDIICYFHKDENSAGSTLEEIYSNVKSSLEEDYYVDPKRSALRLKNKDNENDFHIDVVPGRFIDGDDGDAFLYQSEGEKKRLKTNLTVHINHIKNSKLTDVIKLIKVWKCENNLTLKTFVLELLVIEVLTDKKDKTLSEKLKIFWTKMRDELDDFTVIDPANSNNDLSKLFDDATKASIKALSEAALSCIENNNWETIFNYEVAEGDEGENEQSLALMDISHCQLPAWPTVQSYCTVNIKCFAKDDKNYDKGQLQSDSRAIGDNWTLKYQADAQNMSHTAQIYWQVVNTGDQARDENGLRGSFFKGKDLQGVEMVDQKINLEATRYRGKHWIECFVVDNNRLVARSGRFYINVIPKVKIAKPSLPYWRKKYRK